MKENIIDVLIYLFDNYQMEDPYSNYPNRTDLVEELIKLGFTDAEIGRAFSWLEELSVLCENDETEQNSKQLYSIRQYTKDEATKIDVETQGLLHALEQAGLITSTIREIIIDRIMALDYHECDALSIKWVISMVLDNMGMGERATDLADQLIYADLYLADEH